MFTPTRHRLTALAIILVAAWAGSIAFWGPEFNLGFGDTEAYQWNDRNLILYVIPAAAAALGGLFMLLPRFARVAKLGAWLALAGGLWLLVGPLMSEFVLADEVAFTTDATLASLLFHLAPGFLLTALAGYGIGISTWARRWHTHRQETIDGAREHARRETERDSEEDATAATSGDRTWTAKDTSTDEASDETSRTSDRTEHRAVDHKERRDRELV